MLMAHIKDWLVLKNVYTSFFDLRLLITHVVSGTVVVVIAWWLDLQLPVQSVPITTNVVGSNPVHGDTTLKFGATWCSNI
jgi:hypothetical protein